MEEDRIFGFTRILFSKGEIKQILNDFTLLGRIIFIVLFPLIVLSIICFDILNGFFNLLMKE